MLIVDSLRRQGFNEQYFAHVYLDNGYQFLQVSV